MIMEELSLDRRYDCYKSTIRLCSSETNIRTDEEFLYIIREQLCIDVYWVFSEISLDILLDNELITDEDMDRCLKIRDLYKEGEKQFFALDTAGIKANDKWTSINSIADILLQEQT